MDILMMALISIQVVYYSLEVVCRVKGLYKE